MALRKEGVEDKALGRDDVADKEAEAERRHLEGLDEQTEREQKDEAER